MLDIREILLSSSGEPQNRKNRFSLVGEDDGKGNIIFHKHYLYNPKKKTKAIKIPAKDFWGTTDSFVDRTYKAQSLPKKKAKDSKQKIKKLKAYLKDEISYPKKAKKKITGKYSSKKSA